MLKKKQIMYDLEDIDYFSSCDSKKMIEILQDWIDLINMFTPKYLLEKLFIEDLPWQSHCVLNENKLNLLLHPDDPNASKLCFLLMVTLQNMNIPLPCPRKSLWKIK
jgi:hypothetical protein